MRTPKPASGPDPGKPVQESPAILLRRRAWSETSWIVTWLTRDHGKISTVARGARRPTSQHSGKLDLFFVAEISFAVSRTSSLHSLREVRVVESFPGSPFPNVFLAGYFAELVDLITQPGEPVEPIYSLLERAVAFLRKSQASLRALEYFERELSRSIGAESADPLPALETYCGRIPRSRQAVLRLLKS